MEKGAKKIVGLTGKVDGGDNAGDSIVTECLEDNNEHVWKENLCVE